MTQQTPKVLVTICNYNHERYLEDSIKSIQNQKYTNLDICVVNDGTDNREQFFDIVNKLSSEDNRIRYIDLEKNFGKWHGLNKAIETTDALICTSHDADDISLKERINLQLLTLAKSNTQHNLCGFHHCWTEDDVNKNLDYAVNSTELKYINPEQVRKFVHAGYNHPSINHYFTGEFETAGVSAMFHKKLWEVGIRFNPPGCGLRTLLSEDSDFNLRCTMFASTSVLLEKPYLYRRNTSTNKELK